MHYKFKEQLKKGFFASPEPKWIYELDHLTAYATIEDHGWLLVSLNLQKDILVLTTCYNCEPTISTQIVTDFTIPQVWKESYLNLANFLIQSVLLFLFLT